MEKNVAHVCEMCGEKYKVYMKKYFLGVRFVEECQCCIRLCSDPFEIDWYRYAKEARKEKTK